MALMQRLRRDETTTAETAHRGAAPAPGLAPPPAPAHRATVTRPPVAARAAAPGGPPWAPAALPPSVARVAARTRLSAELLAAILEVDARQRATLDDIERADALAERLLARRADRQRTAVAGRPTSGPAIARAYRPADPPRRSTAARDQPPPSRLVAAG
ncbi:hypothetical protein QOZ89_18660 [Pseudofrankia sp. BMG5.37]|nr:hypothetical protein [Pseudofrankia sp. BMG5.37]MDT3441603.1 hypothetical protein [Pseudofrankia sp. BMG5.37]